MGIVFGVERVSVTQVKGDSEGGFIKMIKLSILLKDIIKLIKE